VVEEDDDDGCVEEGLLKWMVVEEAKSSEARLARRRGSFLGRNLKGVWKTEAADEGGL
jgi:hypothetical protein